jgi:oxygen-independent coproporphyrinogen-3 oxidase
MEDSVTRDAGDGFAIDFPDNGAQPGLYIHIPFCIQKCRYCSFYSLSNLSLIPPFLGALQREAAFYRDWTGRRSFDTLYLGGGTPSTLTAADLERLIGDLAATLPMASGAEITVEANPGDINRPWLVALRRAGVNRLNIGCQSFDDGTLLYLGRRHTAREALEAFERARESGFTNLGLDLIYGLPLRTGEAALTAVDRWRATLETSIRLAPEHLSCYELTLEEGTPLADAIHGEGRHLPDEELRAAYFQDTSATLTRAGYLHYEVSNFARGETLCARHNAKYWDHTPYLGLGPAAHSFTGRTRRWNHRSVEDYLQDLSVGLPPVAGSERLDDEQFRLEALFLGFRTRRGIHLKRFRKRYGLDLAGEKAVMIDRLAAEGLLEIGDDFLRPTTKGLAVADSLALI